MRRARKIFLFLNKKISRLALAFAAGINIFFENKSGNQSERQRSLREKCLVRPAALAAREFALSGLRPRLALLRTGLFVVPVLFSCKEKVDY